MVSAVSAGCCYSGRNRWDCLKKSLIRFPAALIRTTCVYGLSLSLARSLLIYISFRFLLLLGVIKKFVWMLQQIFSFLIIIYLVSVGSTFQMRSQTGNVWRLFPTGTTGMIVLLHQRQILFSKSRANVCGLSTATGRLFLRLWREAPWFILFRFPRM